MSPCRCDARKAQSAFRLSIPEATALATAAGASHFTMARPTAHLTTNAWTIEQFGVAKITVEQADLTRVRVEPSTPLED